VSSAPDTEASTPTSADSTTERAGLPKPLAGVLRSPALRLVGRRLLTAVPVLFGVSLLTFVVMSVLPGSAAQQLLGPDATAEQVAQLEEQLGLDRPAHERYLDWAGGVLTGDLGRSTASQQPVTDAITPRLPVSFQLIGYAFVIALGLAIPLALLAARKPNRLADRISMVISVTGLSAANYVLALIFVLFFAVQFSVFPAIGYVPLSDSLTGHVRSMALPSFAIAFTLFAFYTRFLRGDLLEQMQGEDYILTARAKGIGPWRVLLRHAFRNSLLGLVTLVGLQLGTLIGATVIIEQIFALPGIGQYLLQAINLRDAGAVQAVVLLFATVVVIANLVTDLLYAVLDPRIRYG
jgi:peptide/nickel transport system permease protein